MPIRPSRPCSARVWPRCPHPADPGGLCAQHRAAYRQDADRARGSAASRGYGHAHRTRFRPAVLARDPICTCTDPACGHGAQCMQLSTVADHHPRTRRQLTAAGEDPDDPRHGRGLCKRCHDRHTGTSSPGGWAARG